GHRGQLQLDGDTDHGCHQQDLFTRVLLSDERLGDREFLNFLHDEIWAIHESLRFGLLDDIVRQNSVDQIRSAFRSMLESAASIPDPDAVLALGRRPYIGVSILSEALAKVFPDRFSIKNKRSEWGLYFVLRDASPNYVENEMSYAAFISIAWQLWGILESEYAARKLRFDSTRRLWYVDRFYLWIYERPETKEIMKLQGYSAN